MTRFRTLLLYAVFCLATPSAWAEPDNILVDKYTFTRPKHWQWKAPADSAVSINRFVVPGPTGSVRTDVKFFVLSGTNPDFRKRLLVNFEGEPRQKEETVQVGKIELLYFTGVGTVIEPNNKKVAPKPDHQFTCTLLPTDSTDKHLYVRIAGPRTEVEAALTDFREMVERAVRDVGR